MTKALEEYDLLALISGVFPRKLLESEIYLLREDILTFRLSQKSYKN